MKAGEKGREGKKRGKEERKRKDVKGWKRTGREHSKSAHLPVIGHSRVATNFPQAVHVSNACTMRCSFFPVLFSSLSIPPFPPPSLSLLVISPHIVPVCSSRLPPSL